MGMLLLQDFKILKFMLTAITSSMIIFYALGDLGLITLTMKNLDWGKPVGGLIFGMGMAILGYCPGTIAARIGEGKTESILAVFGTALGIFIYALLIKPIKALLLSSEINGNMSILFGINHWFIVIPIALVFLIIIYLVNRKFHDD